MKTPRLAPGVAAASRNEAIALLRALQMCEHVPPTGAAGRVAPHEARACSTYFDEWMYHRDKQAYDVMLSDLSLLVFRFSEQSVSYCYLACPIEALPYRKFVVEELAAKDPDGYLYATEYEDYIAQAPLVPHPLTLRYDFDPEAFRPGVHPAGHLHVGYRSNVRLASAWLQTPFVFTLQVLRQAYPHVWENQCLSDQKVLAVAGRLREARHRLVDMNNLCERQRLEYHLH